MKGRANYLCRRKLYALRDQPVLSGLEEIDEYQQIAEWEQTTETGDRAELSGLPESSALWHKLDARSEACLGTTCPDYRHCFITEMRRRALESDIIIVNHHLFFADLAVRQMAAGAPDAGILPEAAAVIFDEAHELEEVASQLLRAFALECALRGFCARCRCAAARQGRREQHAGRSRSNCASGRACFLRRCRMSGDGRHPFSDREEFLESSGDLYLACAPRSSLLEAEMERLRDVDEAPGLRSACRGCAPISKFMLEAKATQHGVLAGAARCSTEVTRRKGLHPRSVAAGSSDYIPAGHADRRLASFCASWCWSRFPRWCSLRPRSRCRAALSTCASGSAFSRSARAGGAFALPLWRAGAALSAAADARSARGGVS